MIKIWIAKIQLWLIENGLKLGLIVLLIGGTWFHGYHTASMRREAKIGALEATIEARNDAIAKQNDAVAKLAKDSAERTKRGQDAQRAAAKAIDALSRKIGEYGSYKRPEGLDECQAAKRIVEADNAAK